MASLFVGGRTASRMCPVCSHKDRAEIERLILSIGPDNPSLSIASIANAYDLTVNDLRLHALMHTPLALDFSNESEAMLVNNFRDRAEISDTDATSRQNVASDLAKKSARDRLTDKVNMREGDMLLASANEMLTTLSTLGRRIKTYASDGSSGSDQRLSAFCNTAMVNLYIGTSSELRKCIQAISDLNVTVNGEADSGANGLKALAQALSMSGSQQTKTSSSEED